MPRETKVYTGLEFFEDTKFWLQDQPAGPDDVIRGSGDLSATYDLKIFDVTDAGLPTRVHEETTGNLTLTASVATSGTDLPLWTLDDVGYTASLEVDPANWTTVAGGASPAVPGRTYRIVLLYTWTSAFTGSFPLIWKAKCVPLGGPGTLV